LIDLSAVGKSKGHHCRSTHHAVSFTTACVSQIDLLLIYEFYTDFRSSPMFVSVPIGLQKFFEDEAASDPSYLIR